MRISGPLQAQDASNIDEILRDIERQREMEGSDDDDDNQNDLDDFKELEEE